MRYVVSFVCVLALVGSTLSASGQAEKEGGSRLERWHPEAFKDPSKPAPEPSLELELDASGLEVTPSAQSEAEAERKREEEMRRRRRRGFGIGIPLVAVVGLLVGLAAAAP